MIFFLINFTFTFSTKHRENICSFQNKKTPKEIAENHDILPCEKTAERLQKKLSSPVLTCKKRKQTSGGTTQTEQQPSGETTEQQEGL